MSKFNPGLIIILISALGFSALATEQSPRALVHLLDYLAQDYGGAVGPDRKVISRSEYKEQREFAKRALETNSGLTATANHPDVQEGLLTLQNLIESKAKPLDVAAQAQKIKASVITYSGLEVSPQELPNHAQGTELFQKNCVSCHGVGGKGDGVASKGLDPQPANFWDPGRMAKLSPFKAFNAIRIGVPGTAMAPFPTFSDKEAWALAFYVMSLRHEWASKTSAEISRSQNIGLKTLATSSDDELKKLVKKDELVAALRTQSGNDNTSNPLALARAYLGESLDNYKKGDFATAKTRALMAYLEGIEPVEPKLKASDPAVLAKLEDQMSFVRENIDSKKPVPQVVGAVNLALNQIDVADTLINGAPASPSLTFTVAAAILLREGFEAVLIILALLGVLRASGSQAAARWIHGGWVLALFCGALAWIFSGWLLGITGAQRELMEGLTSVFAVAVLLYMGFWLHSKTESHRWRIFIDDRVNAALKKKNLMGLAIISFTAVFREALETVLFLRALWIEGGMASKTAMVSGVVSSLVLIFVLSWLFLKYSAKLPIKKLFDFSSSLMGILAVILIGKGLHSLQETGLISITASPVNLKFDLIGIYPTVETTVSQTLVLALALALWVYGKRPSRTVRAVE